MPWIITTRSHAGRTGYLLRNGDTTTDRNRAARYPTRAKAIDALITKRLASDVDSAWHHGEVIETGEPRYVDPKPDDGPARLAMLFPGLGNRRIVRK